MTKKVLIIPDVHGRRFWREALGKAASIPVVFLGDYLDPYPDEGIDMEESLEELDAIVDFKRSYPEMVTLLLGNHDLHYLWDRMGGCRYSWRHAYQCRAVLHGNIDLFDIACGMESNGRQFLLSHAGVLRAWYGRHYAITGTETAVGIAALLNGRFHSDTERPALMDALSEISPARGGTRRVGSPVWADLTEHDKDRPEFEGVYQIFGHTFRHKERITPCWACIDCQGVFVLDLDTGEMGRLR